MSELDSLRTSLAAETALIEWSHLQRFFAQGAVRVVDTNEDLVEIATWVAANDVAKVGELMASGQLSLVADSQAQQWFEHDQSLWAVVVKPWILVQEPQDKPA